MGCQRPHLGDQLAIAAETTTLLLHSMARRTAPPPHPTHTPPRLPSDSLRHRRHRLCDRVPDRQRQPLGVGRKGRHHQGRRQGGLTLRAAAGVLPQAPGPRRLPGELTKAGAQEGQAASLVCPQQLLPPGGILRGARDARRGFHVMPARGSARRRTPAHSLLRRLPTLAACCSTSSVRGW